MRKTRSRIRDGFNYPGNIEPVPGEHDGLEFTYRPVLAEESGEVYQHRGVDNAAMHEALRQAIKTHLVEWSEIDAKDAPLPITAENIGALPSELLWALWNKLTAAPPLEDALKNSNPG